MDLALNVLSKPLLDLVVTVNIINNNLPESWPLFFWTFRRILTLRRRRILSQAVRRWFLWTRITSLLWWISVHSHLHYDARIGFRKARTLQTVQRCPLFQWLVFRLPVQNFLEFFIRSVQTVWSILWPFPGANLRLKLVELRPGRPLTVNIIFLNRLPAEYILFFSLSILKSQWYRSFSPQVNFTFNLDIPLQVLG